MPDLAQTRVMGAVRFLDGTTLTKVNGNLNVQSPNVLVRRNRSNLFVIWDAPASGAVVFTVSDPTSNYLSRQFTVTLPRDPDPTHASQEGARHIKPAASIVEKSVDRVRQVVDPIA